MIPVLAVVGAIISINFGRNAIETKMIRVRKSPTDGHGNPIKEENLTGKPAVVIGWFCVAVGIGLSLLTVLILLGIVP